MRLRRATLQLALWTFVALTNGGLGADSSPSYLVGQLPDARTVEDELSSTVAARLDAYRMVTPVSMGGVDVTPQGVHLCFWCESTTGPLTRCFAVASGPDRTDAAEQQVLRKAFSDEELQGRYQPVRIARPGDAAWMRDGRALLVAGCRDPLRDGHLCAQVVDAHAIPTTPTTVLAQGRADTSSKPRITCSGEDGCVVAWLDSEGGRLLAQRLSNAAKPIGPVIEVAALTDTSAATIALAGSREHGFVISWIHGEGDKRTVAVRYYSWEGEATSLLINAARTDASASELSVGVDSEGCATMAWAESDGIGGRAVVSRTTAPDGPVGDAILVIDTGRVGVPRLAVNGRRFALAWMTAVRKGVALVRLRELSVADGLAGTDTNQFIIDRTPADPFLAVRAFGQDDWAIYWREPSQLLGSYLFLRWARASSAPLGRTEVARP